jgi:hypothetical protein
MRILAIGNSFSQDAMRYLNQAALRSGIKMDVTNLMIGGCSLETHYRNMLSGEKRYMLEYNGSYTGFNVSLSEALLTAHWDVITIQQVSNEAPFYSKYEPYLNELAAYVRKCAPKAKLMIHQTWAYEEGSNRLINELKFEKSADMLAKIVESYNKAAEEIGADGIIRSGEMMYKLSQSGIDKVHRDTFHASFGAGRYALSLLWLRTLCKVSVTGNSFADFDAPVTDEEKKIVWEVVDSFEV